MKLNEEGTKDLFERAISTVGRHFKSGNVWLLWIDFQTSLYHMSFVNLICFLAARTPLQQHDQILGK